MAPQQALLPGGARYAYLAVPDRVVSQSEDFVRRQYVETEYRMADSGSIVKNSKKSNHSLKILLYQLTHDK